MRVLSEKKIWAIECIQCKLYIISELNLNIELGQTDQICTEEIPAAEQYTQLVI